MDCSICLENNININNRITLKCEHSFHKNCINKYFGSFCPICKTEFIESNIYYINKNLNNNKFTNVILLQNKIFRTINKFFNIENSIIFLNLLNSKMILSGQLLLSVIQKSNEHINTIDIYVENYFNYKIMTDFLKKNQYIKQNNYNSINYLSTHRSIIEEPIIYKIKKYTQLQTQENANNELNINIIFNVNNQYTIENKFNLDILKNYFDGNHFYIYDITKIELKVDYILKDKLDEKLKNMIEYYRNQNYNIYITNN